MSTHSNITSDIRHTPFEGTDALALAALTKEYPRILYILEDETAIAAAIANLHFVIPNLQVWTLPSWDSMPYDVISPKQATMAARVQALHHLHNKNDGVCLTSINAVMQKTPSPQELMTHFLALQKKQSVDRDALLRTLYQYGYVRSPMAINVGELAVRGSVVDLIPAPDFGIRLDFFGSILEQIKQFDPEDQRSTTAHESIVLNPLSELIFDNLHLDHFRSGYLKQFGHGHQVIGSAVLEGRKAGGAENLLPLFYKSMSTVLDYISNDTLIVTQHLIWEKLHKRWQLIEEYYKRRIDTASSTPYPALSPHTLYIDEQELLKQLSTRLTVLFTPWAAQKAAYKPLPSLTQLATMQQTSIFQVLKHYGHQQRVLIACFSEGSRERLVGILANHEIASYSADSWEQAMNAPIGIICLILFAVEHGFSTPQYAMFSEQDVLGERLSRTAKRPRPHQRFLSEAVALQPGDIVVHIEHGIGRFIGLETLVIHDKAKDFIKIVYANDDALYVPVENFDLVSKYAEGGTVQLDKLGSSSWQNRKARLKQKVKLAATELVKVAAKRAIQEAIILEALPDLYDAFCEKFPYVETEDQMHAIEDVLGDLASGKPTDRLICGDVGFGKTEVAMRAACVAATAPESVQVAVIVPTTLLARQHYSSFTQRFAGLPVRVRQLSKFVSTQEAKATKQGLANGSVDIVIGTQALLEKSLIFKKLGLIIIDEEQHFGVAQKEALKKLKHNTHVLTLSATPIPRTLHMSLSGLKELSLIGTPPIDRLPIRTMVLSQFDPVTIREAILQERMRGGRIFYVTPQISYMQDIEEQLQGIAPEVKIAKAHGRLTALQLDKVMNEFYDGKYDLLLSTAIVESGLDIPMANTMIVDRADHFGLPQLYQIRGRVGRGKSQGYAYFIASRNITSLGLKRLEVLSACDTLGSGFSIASQDMDMRGFGNLLGDEQSGNIREVGMELYQDMLHSAIKEMSNNTTTSQEEDDWSPVLNIGFAAQIPEDYISDSGVRLAMYRQMARTETESELEQLATELIDRFGAPLPTSLNQLITIVKLKQIAKCKYIAKIERGVKGVVITFRSNAKVDAQSVMQLIERHPDKVKFRPEGRLVMLATWQDDQHFLHDLRWIIDSL